MKAKIKHGATLLFNEGASNDWSNLKDVMIINFNDKYTYESFKLTKDGRLFIKVTNGDYIKIVFPGEVPKLEFESYCKDQLVLKILKD